MLCREPYRNSCCCQNLCGVKKWCRYQLKESNETVVEALRQRPQDWVDFMMQFEFGPEKPEPGRALKRTLTIALA